MATTGNAPPRAYAAAHFALELDGKNTVVGLLKSIEGGSIKADSMTYQQGGFLQRWKQVGKPKFEDIKIQTGMAVSAPFLNWVRGFFAGDGVRKTGAIVAADFYYKERARRTFDGALIKEVTIPKLDGQDKSAAYLGVTMAGESLEFTAGSGNVISLQGKGFDEQKSWSSCNFLLDLNGFQQQCKRTTKIDSFPIKQNIVEYHSGGFQPPQTLRRREGGRVVPGQAGRGRARGRRRRQRHLVRDVLAAQREPALDGLFLGRSEKLCDRLPLVGVVDASERLDRGQHECEHVERAARIRLITAAVKRFAHGFTSHCPDRRGKFSAC